MTPEIKSLTLAPKEERRLLRGHLWAYRNELVKPPVLEDGALVDLFSSERRFVGRGFFQAQGGIAARILSKRQDPINQDFFNQRFAEALALRERLFPGATAYRLLFGESDGLPGLVVDRYGSILVAQTACAFYSSAARKIERAAFALPGITGLVFEAPSSDAATRAPQKSTYGEVPDQVEIELDGLKLLVDIQGGQKTGIFLDQRLNAQQISRFAAGKRVFDGHCNAGIWSCRAALAGAASVLGVDTSASALDSARKNAERNGVADRCLFENADVEEALARGEKYDIIVLDPPAFAKSRAAADKALGRYQSINRAAIRALTPGGILISSSCSSFIAPENLLEAIKRAAVAEHRTPLLLEMRGAAPDHPVLLPMPETSYLKCAILTIA